MFVKYVRRLLGNNNHEIKIKCLGTSKLSPRPFTSKYGALVFSAIQLGCHSTTTWTEFCHFLTPSLRGNCLYPERGQKQTFFDPLPPHFIHVVIEWPLAILVVRIIQCLTEIKVLLPKLR